MAFTKFRDEIRRWGFGRSIYVRVMRHLERLLGFTVLVVNSRLLDPNAPEGALPDGCTVCVLDEKTLLGFADDPDLDLPEYFIVDASARGDVCFGYMEFGSLVAYTWVANDKAPALGQLWVRFGKEYSYGYKALTLPSHRGRHLQEHIVHLTDRWQTAHGRRYNIDYIHTLNLASIQADRRYGNRPVGYVVILNWFGKIITLHSPGVKTRKFEFFMPEK